jgi:transcriptional regulator with XRE-family HTH domain
VTEELEPLVPLSGELSLSLSKLLAPDASSIQQMLKDMRQQLRWSQAQLAATLGVPVVTVRAWLNGKRQPSGPSRKLIWLLYGWLVQNRDWKDATEITSWGRIASKLEPLVKSSPEAVEAYLKREKTAAKENAAAV